MENPRLIWGPYFNCNIVVCIHSEKELIDFMDKKEKHIQYKTDELVEEIVEFYDFHGAKGQNWWCIRNKKPANTESMQKIGWESVMEIDNKRREEDERKRNNRNENN